MRRILIVAVHLVCAAAVADEPVDLDLVNRIRDEGFHRSQVMDYARHLTDGIGARVTGSPAMDRAASWARGTLVEIGFREARLEPFEFGRGWSWSRCALDLLAPSSRSLSAIPQAWTPGTAGPVEGEAVRLDVETEEDLAEHAGTLAGKIVLLSPVREVKPNDKAPFRRLGDDELAAEGDYEIPPLDEEESEWLAKRRKEVPFRRALDAFLAEEGALAILEVGSRDGGILRVPRGGESVDPDPMRIPALTVVTEQYNRLVRRIEEGETVRLRLDVEAAFHASDGTADNVVAEIPGTDLKREVVMFGAHLDSYHSGTGAADNAAGVAVMMEAARILRAVGFQPRRTLRIALWAGEEQGLLGSRAWVDRHLVEREPWPEEQMTLPRSLREEAEVVAYRPEHERISGYFNVDNGGGRIRGIYLQGNAAMRPVAEAWLAPFRDLGVTTVSSNDTGSTDHVPFDDVGVPGFQFVQDPLDYFTQTHHTNLDTFDHLHPDDLRQVAVVVASVLAHAANRDEMLPRKPRPPLASGDREPADAGRP